MYCVGNHEIELTNGVKDFLAYETRWVGRARGEARPVVSLWGRVDGERVAQSCGGHAAVGSWSGGPANYETSPRQSQPHPYHLSPPNPHPTFIPPRHRFYFPYRQSLSRSKLYYSYDVAGAHVIMLATYAGEQMGAALAGGGGS